VLLLASDTLKTNSAHSELMPLSAAIRVRWLSFNSESHANTTTVDMDHGEWLAMLDRLVAYECPLPNLVVIDPWTGRAHATWILKDPVRTGEDSLEKPRNLLRLVWRGLTAMLKGDAAYTGRLTKNPWATGAVLKGRGSPAVPAVWEAYQAAGTGLRYHTVTPNPEPVSLFSLRDAVVAFADDEGIDTATWFPWPGGSESDEWSSPGCGLFDRARRRVYKLHRSDPVAAKDPEVVLTIVREEVGASPAHTGQMRSIARSITKFMRTRYGRRVAKKPADVRVPKIGPMGIDPSLPLATKQRMAARHSATLRASRSRERVLQAASDLIDEGVEPTRALIAERSGLARNTVAAFWQAGDRAMSSRCRGHPLVELDAPVDGTDLPFEPVAVPTSSPVNLPRLIVLHEHSQPTVALLSALENFRPFLLRDWLPERLRLEGT
jgi:hypothetical protein